MRSIKVYLTLLEATIVVIVVIDVVVVVVAVVVTNFIALTILVVADPIVFSLVNKCSSRLLRAIVFVSGRRHFYIIILKNLKC